MTSGKIVLRLLRKFFLSCCMFLQQPVLPSPPRKIVSLVPSITELLYDLSLESETIAITKFCIHPEKWFRSKTRIGGTKNIHIEKILSLQPDLVLANKEENVREQIEAVAEHVPVWLTDVNTVEEAVQMITDIGALTHKTDKAQQLIQQILKESSAPLIETPIPVIYLIWQNPFMTVGGDTFIHSMLKHGGFENQYGNALRYPEISEKEIRERAATHILLSSEPYPFNEKHVAMFKHQFPEKTFVLADGTYFSWYGSRMTDAFSYMRSLYKSCS